MLWQWGLRLGQWFGVEVRIHLVFLIWIGLDIIGAAFQGGSVGLLLSAIVALFLFLIVLMHEYGHCFAGRAVGGQADRIIMWPLGGLAYVSAPYRPTSQLIVALGGPLVNVGILLLLTPYIAFNPDAEFAFYFLHIFPSGDGGTFHYFLSMFYGINLELLLFNLIPAFPMDGGRILRSLLWYRFGLTRATLYSVYVARVAAGLMILIGLGFLMGGGQSLILALIGVFVLFGSEQEKRLVEGGGGGQDIFGGFGDMEHGPRRSAVGDWWRTHRDRRQSRKREQETRERIHIEQRVDQLLEKVHREGMHSLSSREKKFLNSASRRFRR